MLAVMRKRSTLMVIAGLGVFPVAWSVLVTAQGVYFGPMRSAFEKIGRRFLDDLPFGWGLFDVLFYLLPIVGIALVAVGAFGMGKRIQAPAMVFGVLSAFVVAAVRMWGPGYL
jgi:hypothetical protein